MSKILLYYPWVGYFKNQDIEHRIPYSLLDLIVPLKKGGFEVELYDGRFREDKLKFYEDVKKDPLFVGITSMTGIQLVDASKTAKYIRKLNDKVPIVWGGWHVSLLPEQSLEEDFVDVVAIGQGEKTVVEIAHAIQDHGRLEDIPSVATKTQRTPKTIRPLCGDYQKIDYTAIDLRRYAPHLGYLSSHGCPLNCTFCAIAQIYKRKFFMRPMDDVVDDLKWVFDHYPNVFEQINIDDDNFFIRRSRVEEFCEKWNNYGRVPIAVLAHVRALLTSGYTADMWKKMVDAGIQTFLIGAESGNQIVLDRLKKHQTPEQMLRFVEKTKQAGAMADLSCLTGFPDSEELDDFKDTMLFVQKAVRINPNLKYKMFWIRPYPGTELFYDFQKRGIKMPSNMNEWSYYTLREKPSWVSERLNALVKWVIYYKIPFGSWDFKWDELLLDFEKDFREDRIPRREQVPVI